LTPHPAVSKSCLASGILTCQILVVCYSCITMKNHKEVSLRREVIKLILYGIALSFVTACFYPYLPDTFARWTAPHTWQPSHNIFIRVNEFVATPMMLSLIACLFSLPTLRHGRDRLPWIAIRVSVVAVMFVMFISTGTTISQGQKIWDRKILEPLAPLRVGMPRSAVEALVLQSNMLVLGKPANGLLHREDIDEYRWELTEHLERAQRGETGRLVHSSYRSLIPGGLFYQNGPNEQAEVHVKRRSGNNMADTGTIDRLNLRFDPQDRLESAVYRREAIERGSVRCEIIFQRSARDPSLCDPTSNGKS